MESRLRHILGRATRTATSVSAVKEQITSFLVSRGLDTFSCTLVLDNHRRLSSPQRIMTTLPDAVVRAYDEKNYDQHDIALDYAASGQHSIFYSTLLGTLKHTAIDPIAKNKNGEISLLYQAFGYNDFYLVPIKKDGNILLFSLALRNGDSRSLMSSIYDKNQLQADHSRPSIKPHSTSTQYH